MVDTKEPSEEFDPSAIPPLNDAESAANSLTEDSLHGSAVPSPTPDLDHGEVVHSPDPTDFRQRFRKFGEPPQLYDILKHKKYQALENKAPYNSGFLLLAFIQRRNTGSAALTAAQNIKLHEDIQLNDLFGYDNEHIIEDYPELDLKNAADRFIAAEGQQYTEKHAKDAILKSGMLNGRLQCRFRSLYEFQDDLIAAFPTHTEEEKITKKRHALEVNKALHRWAVRANGKNGSVIFEKGAQEEVIEKLFEAVNALPQDSDGREKKKYTLAYKLGKKSNLIDRLNAEIPEEKRKKFKLSTEKDLLTLIEEEMDARRRGIKLPAAALFQDLSCNPGGIVFQQGSAFMLKDGDVAHFVGGRVEDWGPLVVDYMKYVHDKDPWSARPQFSGAPEFVTFCISEARKYTWRWAAAGGTPGYDEAFYQFGDQVQAIQQQSPQMHEQGFWVETMIAYNPDKVIGQELVGKDGKGNPIYEPIYEPWWVDEEKKIPRTVSIEAWDPEVANAASKDVDWTFIRNLACKRPSYESGVVRKNYNDVHKQARQGILLRYKDGDLGQKEIDPTFLMQAKLVPIRSTEQYEDFNRKALEIDFTCGLEGRTIPEKQQVAADQQAARARQMQQQGAGSDTQDPAQLESAIDERLKRIFTDPDNPQNAPMLDLIGRIAQHADKNRINDGFPPPSSTTPPTPGAAPAP